MLIIVTYDIADDRTRTKLAHKLKDFGKRVQYSVFEADVTDNEMEELFEKLAKVKLAKEDSIRFYRICGECKKHVKIWGAGEITEDKDFYIA